MAKAKDPMLLPLLDGERPDNVKNFFSGNVVLDPPVGQSVHRDSVGYALVEYVAGEIGGRSTTKDGLLSRTQRLKVVRMAHVGYDEGGAMLLELHKAAREAAGISELDLGGDPDALDAPALPPVEVPEDPDGFADPGPDGYPDPEEVAESSAATKPADWRDQLADANADDEAGS